MKDNQTNKDFLASLSEYRTQAPHYSGDVVSIEDHEEELNRTPGRGLNLGSLLPHFPFTGLQAFFAIAIVQMLTIQKVFLFTLACTLMPSIASARNSLSLK